MKVLSDSSNPVIVLDHEEVVTLVAAGHPYRLQVDKDRLLVSASARSPDDRVAVVSALHDQIGLALEPKE